MCPEQRPTLTATRWTFDLVECYLNAMSPLDLIGRKHSQPTLYFMYASILNIEVVCHLKV
eukprot:6022388-Amphidinium_carterae.2